MKQVFNLTKGLVFIAVACMVEACSCSKPEIPPPPPTTPVIRVLLTDAAKTLQISVPGQFSISAGNLKVLSGDELEKTLVTFANNEIIVGNIVRTQNPITISPVRVPVNINGQNYRGSVTLRVDKGRMVLLNNVDLEGYVCGVVPAEMYVYWPAAALEAQAIAARTYAVTRIEAKRGDIFDVYATTHDQKYSGFDKEDDRTTAAVTATAGKILKWRGKPFVAYYHSTCAGLTADAKLLFNNESAPLKGGVQCSYCSESPRYKWQKKISLIETRKLLGVNDLAGLGAENITLDGRVGRVMLHRRTGQPVAMPALTFRSKLGLGSTRFEISAAAADFIIKGYGFGHGVGLCQWGAYGMAKVGKQCDEILKKYYPGSEIVKEY